jgi:hypothetical protein
MLEQIAGLAVELICFRWLYDDDSDMPRWLGLLLTALLIAGVGGLIWYMLR